MKVNVERLAKILLALILSILILANAVPVLAIDRTVNGVVDRVIDGDSLHVITPEGTKLRIRLAYIDAPETAKPNLSQPGQPFGEEATEYLKNLVFGKNVTVRIVDIDRHRRLVAVIVIGDMSVNLQMVKSGMAECYREYLTASVKAEYLEAEEIAKMQRLGIWSLDDYARPSD